MKYKSNAQIKVKHCNCGWIFFYHAGIFKKQKLHSCKLVDFNILCCTLGWITLW